MSSIIGCIKYVHHQRNSLPPLYPSFRIGETDPKEKVRWLTTLFSLFRQKIERWGGVVASYERQSYTGMYFGATWTIWSLRETIFVKKCFFKYPLSPSHLPAWYHASRLAGGIGKDIFSWNLLSKRLNGPRRSKIYSRMLVRPPKKGLVTTPADFEIVIHFRDFDPPPHTHHHFGKESPAGTKNRVEKINFWWFFKITPGGHQTFLGPN